MIDPVLEMVVRLGLAVLLFSAFCHKLRAFGVFVGTIVNYRIVPAFLARPMALVLVCGELGLAVSLMVHFTPIVGAAVAFLLVAYGSAIAINLLRGRASIDCGCTGPYERQTGLSWGLVFRNIFLALVALAICIPALERPFSWLDLVVVSVAVTCSIILYTSIEMLIRQFTVSHNYLEQTTGT